MPKPAKAHLPIRSDIDLSLIDDETGREHEAGFLFYTSCRYSALTTDHSRQLTRHSYYYRVRLTQRCFASRRHHYVEHLPVPTIF